MTRKDSGASTTPDTGPGDTIEALVGGNGENVAAVLQCSSALISGVSAYGEEVTAFANRCLSANLERSDALLRCRDMEEAFRRNCEFARAATEHYFEEADRLIGLAAKISRDCWMPLEHRGRKALRELSRDATTSTQT